MPDDKAKVRAHIQAQAEAEDEARRYQDDWNEGRVTQMPDGTYAFWSDYIEPAEPPPKVPAVAPAPDAWVNLDVAAAYLGESEESFRKKVLRACKGSKEGEADGLQFRHVAGRWKVRLGGWVR